MFQGAINSHLGSRDNLHWSPCIPLGPSPAHSKASSCCPSIASCCSEVKTDTSPQISRSCMVLSSSQQTLSVYRALVNILGFADPVIFVSTTQLCHCSKKAPTDEMEKKITCMCSNKTLCRKKPSRLDLAGRP